MARFADRSRRERSRCSGRSALRTALLLLGGGGLVVPAEAAAYDVKRTSGDQLVHWEKPSVRFQLDGAIDRRVPRATNAVEEALASWSGTVGAPELTAESSTSPMVTGFDGDNSVRFAPTGWAPAGRALAITVLTYDDVSGAILDADVVVNGQYDFAVLAPEASEVPRGSGTKLTSTDGIDVHVERDDVERYDLHHVIAHEFGHALGLNDELAERSALMYRYSSPNDPSVRVPSDDDISGLAQLYGTNVTANGNGCGAATVAPRAPSRSASSAATWITLGLGLFVTVRGGSRRRGAVGLGVVLGAGAFVLMPDVTRDDATPIAQAATAPVMARAVVTRATTSIEDGLFKTTFDLRGVRCASGPCPSLGVGVAWGGVMGTIRQEVGDHFAPRAGAEVQVALSPSAPLARIGAPLTKAADGTAPQVVRFVRPAR